MRHPGGNSTEAQGQQHVGSKRNRWGVILAGGDGTRLQPLTRLACGDNRPKQFCPLLSGETLLSHTRQRIAQAIDPDRVLFVLTRKHEQFYRESLACIPGSQKIVQPRNQGTLPAILWSLLHVYRADKHAVVAFFPSDHYFGNEGAFLRTIERSFELARQNPDSVILLGAGAERPETEYGWIEPEQAIEGMDGYDAVRVRRFWEKPPLETARKLWEQGCFWNTFVMIGSAAAFLAVIRDATPLLAEEFQAALSSGGQDDQQQKMRVVYDHLDSPDFSRAVLAVSTEKLLVASCGAVGWSDLGEPGRFISALTENSGENSWVAAGVCSKCGLTREQIVTLSGHGEAGVAPDESLALTSPA